MGNILKKYNLTKGQWEVIGGAITGDTLPIGSEVDYDGTTIPNGWEEIDDVVVTENVVSRNLYNKNNSYRIGAQNQDIANNISLKPNTDYCFNTGKTWTQVTLFNTSGEVTRVIGGTETTDSIQFTTTSNEVKGTFQFYAGAGTDTETYDFTGIQLEKGTSATNYTPYLNMQELENKTKITTGKGTVNSDYISAVEYNHWERCGNVVSYSFTMTVNGVWDNITKFISGLPKAKEAVRFLGVTTLGDGVLLRLSVSKNGEIANSFSGKIPEKGNIIEGHITYITDEEATI